VKRNRWVLAGAAVLVVAAATGGVVVMSSATQTAQAAPEPPANTAKVEKGEAFSHGLPGAAVTAVYASSNSWAVVILVEAWAGGIAAAILIGAFAGLMPAVRASRMPPSGIHTV
jgi:ABC-type antimicrobial peptide transport system permease subunit